MSLEFFIILLLILWLAGLIAIPVGPSIHVLLLIILVLVVIRYLPPPR